MDDLKQDELMAFAPKARVAQPRSPAAVPFPFMNLPLELRTMVYKIHFSQPAEPHHFVPLEQRLSLCYLDELPFGRCPIRTFNEGVPVRQLWTLSKTLYHEAMPLYFQTTEFRFNSFNSLGQFLNVIGPYHRQHVTSVILNNCYFDSSEDNENCLLDHEIHSGLKALKLLRSCPVLRHVKITIPASVSHMAETSALFRAILKIRDLKSLDVYGFWSRHCRQDAEFPEFHKYNEQALQVLKRPRSPAAVKEREEKGISRVAVPRTFFGSINSVVAEWFDVRESETVTKSFEDNASGYTELKYLKRERRLVEASFSRFKDEQNQVFKPL